MWTVYIDRVVKEKLFRYVCNYWIIVFKLLEVWCTTVIWYIIRVFGQYSECFINNHDPLWSNSFVTRSITCCSQNRITHPHISEHAFRCRYSIQRRSSYSYIRACMQWYFMRRYVTHYSIDSRTFYELVSLSHTIIDVSPAPWSHYKFIIYARETLWFTIGRVLTLNFQ